MTEDAAPKTVFPPARRFAYWPWTVFLLGLYIFLMWEFGAFEMKGRESFSQFLSRASFTMLFWSPMLLIGGAFLLLPPKRRGVRVEPGGLVFEPVGRGATTRLPWEAIEKIERRMQFRRPDALWFGIREGHREGVGRTYKLVGDLFEGSLTELLTAIREVAPEAGYRLKGHRLDIDHWGGETWWLERGEDS